MRTLDERFQARSEIKQSGPVRVAECDCHDCEGSSSLNSEICRRCVFSGLGGEDEVERVILKKTYHHIYPTSKVSKLAKTLATVKEALWDHTSYASESKEDKCEFCIHRRMERLKEVWTGLLENPHELHELDKALEEEEFSSDDCIVCTEKKFSRLVESIKRALKDHPSCGGHDSWNYDEALNAKVQPFFIEGLWKSPKNGVSQIDSYSLPEERGDVRIYRQKDRAIPFYELDLPEFNLPEEHVKLLDEAFQMEIEAAPNHARFARPSHMLGFAKDWYNTLLHLVKEREDMSVSSTQLQNLAKKMANWLTYRILEPLSHDENITDIYIEAPPEIQPVRVVHQRWGHCETGIFWSSPSLLGVAENLASKLGRSFDEPQPQLDAEIPELGLRLFISRDPAIWNDNSAAAAIRRRRSQPWTQPLFMDEGSITPLASATVSNLIRTGASVFTIGDIGTAKTSFLTTQIPEIGPAERIIAFQDTEELQFEKFVEHGYELENVRISDPKHLQKQIDAFLRGGSAYWFITEVRSTEAIESALGAAARRGSQPILSTFHARTKRQMFDLICNIMGLHEAAYKHIDFIISTGKFDTSGGTVRRVTEVSEVLKNWEGDPEYIQLFDDNREKDILEPGKIFDGPEGLIEKVNSYDLTDMEPTETAEEIDFLPADEGGSRYIPRSSERLAIDRDELLLRILSEARMKSELLMLARWSGNRRYLELPFISKSYDKYFYELERQNFDYERTLVNWLDWLGGEK